MDVSSLIGLILGVGALLGGFVWEGGQLSTLFSHQGSAALIVFGGTIGAVVLATPMEKLSEVPQIFKRVFSGKTRNPLETIDELVSLATIARREGVLALEEKIEDYEDEFFKNGIQLVVDGVDPDLVRQVLETELSTLEAKDETGVHMFELAGGFAPTMGIIGTVMGLVHVLGNLSSPETLGPLISSAFIATLYGVSSANVIWLPIAGKLKNKSKQEILLHEIMMEGILSIQAGENPNILGQKLKVFLAPGAREAKSKAVAGNVQTS